MPVTDFRRLFFALWPDARTRQALRSVQDGLGAGCGRLTHPADLHVTLVFLGNVESGRMPCIETVADGIHAGPFELHFDRLDYWRRPRILWCGPSGRPPALDALVHNLQAGLQACHIEPDQRPYAPHVTLARKARPVDVRDPGVGLHWQVRDFVLVASRSGAEPPRYEVLRRWPLV